MLDTDIAIDLVDGAPYALHLFDRVVAGKVLLSIISYAEIQEGVLGSRNKPLKEQEFARLLLLVELCNVDRMVADAATTIWRDLRSRKRAMKHRSLDLLIAATALAYDAVLVTRNYKDFDDIPGIVFYPIDVSET